MPALVAVAALACVPEAASPAYVLEGQTAPAPRHTEEGIRSHDVESREKPREPGPGTQGHRHHRKAGLSRKTMVPSGLCSCQFPTGCDQVSRRRRRRALKA